MKIPITFVVPVSDDAVYEKCFAASPLFKLDGTVERFCQKGFGNASMAFNKAIDEAKNDILVFCHQDIMFPASWGHRFVERLEELNSVDPHWGVVGCAGMTDRSEVAAHLYRHDRELIGQVGLPAKIRTVDECIISFRRSSGLRFDTNLPGFFFYAVDMCLQAEARKLNNYVLDCPCFHQAKESGFRPGFFKTETFIVRKWRERLPIQTLSGPLVSHEYTTYKRLRYQLEKALMKLGRRKPPWWIDLPKISLKDPLG
jgi:hypothetical protein